MPVERMPEKTPEGWAQRLAQEFDLARKEIEPWRKQTERALKAYGGRHSPEHGSPRWNLYTADMQTLRAMLYGSEPSIIVSRRFADPADDVARVAGEMQERLLNADIQGDDDTFRDALQHALEDSLITDFGLARVRYDIGETTELPGTEERRDPVTGEVLAEAVPGRVLRPNERVETDYVHHADVLWSPARVWSQVRWVAFGLDVPVPEMRRKFGDEVTDRLPVIGREKSADDGTPPSPWDKIRLWEVWSKDEREVFWFVEGAERVLAPIGVAMSKSGGQPDPLELPGFFPCPPPLSLNSTTSKFLPRPDYDVAADIYEEISDLSRRIGELQRAIRVVGVYDASNPQLADLLSSGDNNKMVAVQNFGALSERGGLSGSVDWLPLDKVVAALMGLREHRAEQIAALRQITGMSDVMRGQSMDAGRTATSDRIMARFGSVRLQWRQQRFAEFASHIQTMRARIVARMFDDATIIERSNVARTPDAEMAPAALALIRERGNEYRIQIRPESLGMTDFDALKSERTEVAAAISQFIAAVMPLVQSMPQALPEVLEMLQWVAAGVRGGSEIEAVLDRAIESAKRAAQQGAGQQGPPPPEMMKLQAQQLKGQQELAKERAKLEAELIRQRAEVQAKAEIERNQADANVAEAARKLALQRATGGPQSGGIGA